MSNSKQPSHVGLAQKLHIKSGKDEKTPWWKQLLIDKKRRDEEEKKKKK